MRSWPGEGQLTTSSDRHTHEGRKQTHFLGLPNQMHSVSGDKTGPEFSEKST